MDTVHDTGKYQRDNDAAEALAFGRVTMTCGEESWSGTLGRFIGDNADDPDLCALVLALKRGERIVEGGGAAQLFTIIREA
jgi:hypothetical protein